MRHPSLPRRGSRSGFTLLELMVVVAIIGILAALATSNFRTMQWKAKRAEVPSNVSGIWVAEVAYDAAEDGFVQMSMNPASTPGKDPRDFDMTGSGWETIGWRPDGPVRGSYSVTVSADATEFTVFGEADVDGDGNRCQYTANENQSPVLRTGDENVF